MKSYALSEPEHIQTCFDGSVIIMSKFFEELLKSAEEAVKISKGELKPSRITRIPKPDKTKEDGKTKAP